MKELTCKIYIEERGGYRAAIRLDSPYEGNAHEIRLVQGEIAEDWVGHKIKISPDVHYLMGEAAEKLYAYEQLGYSPEELKEIIRRYRMYRTGLNSIYGITVMPARQNGKSRMELAKILGTMEEMQDEYERFCKGEWPKKNPTLDIASLYPSTMPVPRTPAPENVIFNDPATIVFWKDGTKTVVKATDEDFDPEKGLAMAISRKALGNKRDYYNVFKKWLKKYKPAPEITNPFTSLHEGLARASESMKKLTDALKVAKEDTDNG